MTVSFNEGAENGDTSCANVEIIDDGDFEGVHSFTSEITSFSPISVNIAVDTSLANIIIMDDDGEIQRCSLFCVFNNHASEENNEQTTTINGLYVLESIKEMKRCIVLLSIKKVWKITLYNV